jgi:hypothetical protein
MSVLAKPHVPLVPLLAGIVAIALGAAAAALWQGAVHQGAPAHSTGPRSGATHELSPYTEDVAILLGSYTCRASSMPGVGVATAHLLDSLREVARAKRDSFATIGVAIDGPLRKGLSWLRRFGDFDEVVVGRNWHNSVVAKYIWSDPDAKAALPQLLLIQHRITPSEHGLHIGRDSVLHRWLGADELAPRAVEAIGDSIRPSQ